MRHFNPRSTPLLEVLRRCTTKEQIEMAGWAGTTRNYLYQLATCQRTSTNLRKALGIINAINQMHARTLGRVPKITIEQLANMCPECGGDCADKMRGAKA
jgi:hypothetical protein